MNEEEDDDKEQYKRYRRWLLPNTAEERVHRPQPYIQMADALADLGYKKHAEDIRILERQENLRQLTGFEGAWQWFIGRTTEFGYQPQNALFWLAILILAGTIVLTVATVDLVRMTKYRWALVLPVFAALPALLIYWLVIAHRGQFFAEDITPILWRALYALMEGEPQDAFSVGDVNATGALIIVFCFLIGLLFVGGAIKLKDVSSDHATRGAEGSIRAEKRWMRAWKALRSILRLCSVAFLYSVDRAVPFLSFDSEHVKWFKDKHHLNDRPLLCLYFYIHAILGFTFISLFLAGLTGILK